MVTAANRLDLKRRFFDRVMLFNQVTEEPRFGLVGQLGFYLNGVFGVSAGSVNGSGSSPINDLRLFMQEVAVTPEQVARWAENDSLQMAAHRAFMKKHEGQPNAIRRHNKRAELEGRQDYLLANDVKPDEPNTPGDDL